MGYADTTVVTIYWKPYRPFFIHRSHHNCFDSYNSRLSIEENHNPGSLILQKYHESIIHHSDLINLIPCELDLSSIPFFDTTVLTYENDNFYQWRRSHHSPRNS